MAPDLMLFQRDCVPCPDVVPPCSCASDETCVLVEKTCNACASNQCVPNSSSGSSSSSSSVSGGAVAGAVIASVVFLAAVLLAFLWYRKRQRLRRAAEPAADAKPDVPARAEDVLNRPDPNEKPNVPEAQEMHTVRIYGGASNTTINLDPESQGDSVAATHGHNPTRMSTQSNPFADSHSIQSASTGTQSNVIPIAFVPPGSLHSGSSNGVHAERAGDLNLDHANVSGDSLPAGKQYARSQVSGLRNSYMTTGSFASDLLNEAPVIVTPSQGAVKQVLGVVKAEVIRTPPGSVYSSSENNKSTGSLSAASSRPPVRSPLAGGSFGPLESMAEEQEEQDVTVRGDPFGDEHSPFPADSPTVANSNSPAPTTTTFAESDQQWDSQGPRSAWKKLKEPRPASVNTQAGSIIGATITSASRVHIGLDQLSPHRSPSQTLVVPGSSDLPHTPVSAPLSTARSQHRMTSAKIISPMSGSEATPTMRSGVLERQQRQAIEEMEATRMDRASVVSSASTRADSILEGFPFVPPSPISDRPIRTPPRSPLAQQAFSGRSTSPSKPAPETPLPPPPNRKLLGMSTASQSSTMSNGLGSFPFQIDNGNGPVSAEQSAAPSSYPGKQRASLDTLALTADLQSYPLGFDREAAMAHYPPHNNRQ